MDPDFIKVIVIAGVILIGIARGFYRIFVKPFLPTPGQGPAAPAGKGLKDFLEELRRGLGHGEGSPPPVEKGLIDEAREEPPVLPDPDRLRRPPAAPEPPPPPPRAPRRPDPRTPSERDIEKARRRARARNAVAEEQPVGIARVATVSAPASVAGIARPAATARSAGDPVRSGKFLGIDLRTAIIAREVLGPPRAHRPLRFGPARRRGE